MPDAWTVADLSTLRIWPLHAGVAVCMLDLVESVDDHGLVEWAPCSLLRRQVAELARVGFALRCATETEFHLFHRREEELARNNYHEPSPITPNLGLHIEGLLAAFDVIAELLRASSKRGSVRTCAAAEFGPGQLAIRN